jgi:hypothetical protein
VSDTLKPELPPPRHEDSEDGRRPLIEDEQEWLARPAPWGIGKLPEQVRWRKQQIYNFYNHARLATFLTCDVCRQRVVDLYTEEGFVPRTHSTDMKPWYDETHPVGQPCCDAWEVWKKCIQHHRDIICAAEAENAILGVLYDVLYTPSRGTLLQNTVVKVYERLRALELWHTDIALELVGPNPFRPVAFSLTWRTSTAVVIARGMYESRDFGAMPILADALQDAGCDNADILTHCRDEKQVHVRGCWVIDLVLEKA